MNRNALQTVSLQRIADDLQVNISTVSRALGGDAGVGAERAAQIRKRAAELNYRPRPLRRKRAGAIALIVGTRRSGGPDDAHQQRTSFLAEKFAAKRGLHLNVEFVDRDSTTTEIPATVSSNRVDGVLLTGHPPAELCHQLVWQGVPAVAFNDTLERTRCSCVLADPAPALAEAIDRLVALGHRDLGLVISQRRYPTVARRYAAFTEALSQYELPSNPQRVLEGFESNLRGGRFAIQRYLAAGPLPQVIIFENDWMALGGMYELAGRGLRVPRDVSIVGCDNTDIAEEMSPSLTSIDLGERDAVEAALDLLQQRIEMPQAEPRQVPMPTRLVWRDSCGPAGGEKAIEP